MRMFDRVSLSAPVIALIAAIGFKAAAAPVITTNNSQTTFSISDYTGNLPQQRYIFGTTAGELEVTPSAGTAPGDPPLRLAIQTGPDPRLTAAVRVAHYFDAFTYDPAASGAIETIDFSLERLGFQKVLGPLGMTLTLFAEQGGIDYFIAPPNGFIAFDEHVADVFSVEGIVPLDFRASDFSTMLDFSETGAPITFGFTTDLQTSTIDLSADIGTFSVTVNRPGSIPGPLSLALILPALWLLSSSRRGSRR